MSYEPTNWKTGDVVTSAKLNKLENGVAQSGGVYIVHNVDGTLDKTFNEIASAAEKNAVIIETGPILGSIEYWFVCGISESNFLVSATYQTNVIDFIAESRESYPVVQSN